MEFQSARLRFVPCSAVIIKAIEAGSNTLSETIDARVLKPVDLSVFEQIHFIREKIFHQVPGTHWYTWLSINKEQNVLIGSGGFKGPPDALGRVEIGYEVSEQWQNHGFASEMAQLLVEHAFRFPEVKVVIAHTLLELNASTSVLKKCGFSNLGKVLDTLDGSLWRWQKSKN